MQPVTPRMGNISQPELRHKKQKVCAKKIFFQHFSFAEMVYNTYCDIPKEDLCSYKNITVNIISAIKGKSIVPCTQESHVGGGMGYRPVRGGGRGQAGTVAGKGRVNLHCRLVHFLAIAHGAIF